MAIGLELTALRAPRRQRKRFIRSGHGDRSHRNARHVLRAALDLAHALAASGGQDSDGILYERGEIARLREPVAH